MCYQGMAGLLKHPRVCIVTKRPEHVTTIQLSLFIYFTAICTKLGGLHFTTGVIKT